jgi:hypothetical protein
MQIEATQEKQQTQEYKIMLNKITQKTLIYNFITEYFFLNNLSL